jgi:hypothetical protein
MFAIGYGIFLEQFHTPIIFSHHEPSSSKTWQNPLEKIARTNLATTNPKTLKALCLPSSLALSNKQ